VLQDLRYAWRTLVRMRGAGVIAIVALALGIGGTTAMFSVVYAALVRPVPFPDPDGLAILYNVERTEQGNTRRWRWAPPGLRALDAPFTTIESAAAFTRPSVGVAGGTGQPEQIDAEIVTPGYLTVLRVAPIHGRVFGPADDQAPGSSPVVVIGERLWRSRFGADPAIVGQTIRVNNVPLNVIGILPEPFAGVSGRARLWLPRAMAPLLTYAEYLTTPQHFISAIARLRPGATFEAATAELAARSAVVTGEDPSEAPRSTWSIAAVPIADARIEGGLRRSAVALLSASACVLLIACVNVAGVLLARARTRRREVAIRVAIGSSTGRLMRQLLTEGAVLAAVAAAGGMFLAMWIVRVFAQLSPAVIATGANDYGSISTFAVPALSLPVLAFALVVAMATALLFSVIPALAAARAQLAPALRDGDRGSDRGRRRTLGGLVVGEIALAVLLVAGSALLIGSFARSQDQRTGFVPDGVLTFRVQPPSSYYPPESGPATLEKLLGRIQQVPGVEVAAVNRCVPFSGCSRTGLHLADRPGDAAEMVGRHYISSDYFKALGIPLVSGRGITADDRMGRPPVTVVNQAGARRFWPGQNPIGKRVWFTSATGFTNPASPVEVVGVAGDVKYESFDQTIPAQFYTSYQQFSYPDSLVIVKSRLDAAAMVPALRAAVASVDSSLPIFEAQTLDEFIGGALARPRFNATVVALFAIAAVLLSAIGVYGMLSYTVAARLREMGVRLALGADRRQVLGLVVREGLALAVVGASIGAVASVGASRFMQGLVAGIDSGDLRLLFAGVPILIVVAALAAYVPARRAAGVDPVVVLRTE
jgi:predicted permease